MRFVARLAIASALCTSAAAACFGQAARFAAGAPPLSGAAAPISTARVDLRPPAGVEGTWVSDDGEGESQYESLPYDGMMDSGGFAGEMGDCGPEGCDDESCDDFGDGCDPFAGAAGGPACGKGCHVMNLWEEVHAHRRIWIQGDYLAFWAKGNPLPPLVTTSPVGTPQSQAGVLPVSATTSILFGGNRVDTEQRNGARLNFGYWIVDGEFIGVEGHYFALQQANTTFNAASDFATNPDSQILARPYVDVGPGVISPTEASALVAFPDFVIGPSIVNLAGRIDIRTTSNIQSAGALWRRLIWIDFTSQRRLDAVLGYRFFRLDDSVTINDESTITGGQFPTTVLTSQDIFSTRNFFNGGEIGLKFYQYHGPFSLEVIAKSAFGNNEEVTVIKGTNSITAGGVTTTTPGGFLTQPTNIGTHVRNTFAILPEGDVNLRLNVTRNVRLTMGYTFIYINRVQRSGDAINRNLNPTQLNGGALVGNAQPTFSPTDSTFWVHGATAGVEVRW